MIAERHWTRKRAFEFFWQVVVLIAVLAFFLTDCAFMPNEATPFTPPESYRAVWAEAEACTGRTGDFNRISWWKVPGEEFDMRGDPAAGAADHKRIFLAETFLYHPMVVKHEMIHILIGSGHPDVPFAVPCKATWDSWEPTAERLAP